MYSLATARLAGISSPSFPINDILLDDRSFMFTSETIKKLAVEPCIIVGRCADHVLENRKSSFAAAKELLSAYFREAREAKE